MFRSRSFAALSLAVATIGGLTIAVMALAAPPAPPTPEQGRAEAACREQGVLPNSGAWELCLSHVTRAFEWGEANLAQRLAAATGDARETCVASGLATDSAAFRDCIDVGVDARTQLLILGDDRNGDNVAKSQ
ncbi:MAG: hypothetical protein ACHQK9_13495 [Reyranellales bacterium]